MGIEVSSLSSPALRAYIDAKYGSLDNLYMEILDDFFRHAFDRSGADNFYDAGVVSHECLELVRGAREKAVLPNFPTHR